MAATAPYLPDDARITTDALTFLRTLAGIDLRAAVASLPDPEHPAVSDIARLRKTFPPEPLHAALVLAALQPKARLKFPDIPYIWATPEALEQATSRAVARHKASAFADVCHGRRARGLADHASNDTRLYDLCSGIGGDALALSEQFPITAVELSQVRAACLRYNAADRFSATHPVDVRVDDLRDLLPSLPPDALVHIDPARRSAGHRSPRYADLIPGPPVLEDLFRRVAGGAVKLSPAVDFDELPSVPPSHLELISHNGSVMQTVWWRGTLAAQFPTTSDSRTFTVLADDHPPFQFTAPPERVVLDPDRLHALLFEHPAGNFLCELDGAATRLSLAAPFARSLGLLPLTSDGGYLLSPSLPFHDVNPHPALTPFEIVAVVPYSEQRVAKTLRQLPPAAPGPVEVKCRGRLSGIDTDQLQIAWSKLTGSVRTVLIFPFQKDVLAVIARRLNPTPGAHSV